MKRVVVSHGCRTQCPSCVACRPGSPSAPLQEALDFAAAPELLLGGGDATAWPHLDALLDENRRRERPQRIWVEAPARALSTDTLRRLATGGVHGVLVQIEATGAALIRALGVGDGERAIAEAESMGLATQARLCVRPKTFAIVVPLSRRLAPRPVWLELIRQDWGAAPVPMPTAPVEKTLLDSDNLAFSAHRLADRGYLPPCVLPTAWALRPSIWKATFRERLVPNAALPACADCALSRRCQWNDAGALRAEALEIARPIRALPVETGPSMSTSAKVLASARRRSADATEIVCAAPWTTLEVVDPDGKVRQCCADWTVGDRGNLFTSTLADTWNGPGYRAARRIMSGQSLDGLCHTVCPRLYDRKFSEDKFEIHAGADAYVRNQLLMAEEIAERREELRSKPLYLALCPSTYCNYDCIMCLHGRSPRRELPESIWEELPTLLPTLRVLTFLGGEPLANPLAMRFLRQFDRALYPDAAVSLVTNGSLLGEGTLKHMRKCTFGHVTVSLNAGTPEVYAEVQRGIALDEVLANIDALVRFRAEQPRPFGITASFVVQPANAHTLVEFGQLAHARDLGVRLLPLSPHGPEGLDYYDDADTVARILEQLDRFAAWATPLRPEWLPEINASREAIRGEAANRHPSITGLKATHLPIVR